MDDLLTQYGEGEHITPLGDEVKKALIQVATTVRGLTMDATEKAKSGHPGMPMGCAEIGAYLYGVALKYDPKNPNWINRDRFILSGGHGSMLLYSLLHLSGFNLSIEDLKQFRQLHSKTPGHPEEKDTEGVETTTGPLGQGVGNAVGQALGLKILAQKFNTEKHKIFDSKVFVLMTDGDCMEGVVSEVSSLAGHWRLDNLIALYDSNHISLDGPLSQSMTEDTKLRYRSYGWKVYQVDGHDLDALHQVIAEVKNHQEGPTLIICNTIIGKGAPHKAGTNKVHGSPLGEEEVRAAKEALGIPEEPFYVPQQVYDYFKEKRAHQEKEEAVWNERFNAWAKVNPTLFEEFKQMSQRALPENFEAELKAIEVPSPVGGRIASNHVIQYLADALPYLYGGSADLSCSDMTMMSQYSIIGPSSFSGRNIKFGVREFGMALIATGLTQTRMIVPYIGTFLTFSDYMRNAIRLCSLMNERVIYQFTHDSIFLGEDGPTHQPIEHLAALRAMPNLFVIRPADANEVKMAWIAALTYKGPTALILSRQSLPILEGTDVSYAEGIGRGAYILQKEKGQPDFTLVATGSEVSLASDVAEELIKRGKNVRLVSMPCWELFEKQPESYKESVFGGNLGVRVSIEAGSEQGWHKYVGSDGVTVCIDQFGASAPGKALALEFGFTVDAILERLL